MVEGTLVLQVVEEYIPALLEEVVEEEDIAFLMDVVHENHHDYCDEVYVF